MEACSEQGLDSPSRNSYVGSYYQPPDTMIHLPRRLDFPFHSIVDSAIPTTSHRVSHPKSNIDSKAVVDALRTLQDKINQEAETSRHSVQCPQRPQDNESNSQITGLTTLPTTLNHQPTNEHDRIMKCKTLQKHLEMTKQCIEQAKKQSSTLPETQTSEQNEQLNISIQLQNVKLKKLESKYEKLSKTQSLSERKLAMLEEKLQKEQHERLLVQEKAEELQREFDTTLRLNTEEMKEKKKTKNPAKKSLRGSELKSQSRPFNQKMPFVAGMSTSTSHSVHANVQSILHIMKHHQPQLHGRVSLLHNYSHSGVRKGLHKDFSNTIHQTPSRDSSKSEAAMGSLSDLLLALQDELGQMSFMQQELMLQIDSALDHKTRQDLKNELEQLVSKMEEKGAQITKLRKHIHKMAKDKQTEKTIHPPAPSPVKPMRRGPKPSWSNLQLLRQTQEFRNSLQQSDLSWET